MRRKQQTTIDPRRTERGGIERLFRSTAAGLRLSCSVILACIIGGCAGGTSDVLTTCPSYTSPPPAIGDRCSGVWSCDYHNARYCNGSFACVDGRVSGHCDPADGGPTDGGPLDANSHDAGPTLCVQMQGQCVGTTRSSFGCTVQCPIGRVLAGSTGQTETSGPCFMPAPPPDPYGCPVSSSSWSACCIPAPDAGDGDGGDGESDASGLDGGGG